KWIRYAGGLLDAYVGRGSGSDEFNQALLQHYGWRAFYIDCSANPMIAAWFASHTYQSKRQVELSEDYEERHDMLVKTYASYGFEPGEGHLYVFKRDAIAESIGIFDLSAIKIDGFRPRPEVQSAWLLGPLRNAAVPLECFAAHIRCDREIFRDFASGG